MFRYILLPVFLLFFNIENLLAQDKIITIQGDTINCIILKVSNEKIEYQQNSGGIQANVTVRRNDVKECFKGDSLISNNYYPFEMTAIQKWKISVNAGIGYRLASTKDSKQALINQGFNSSEIDSYFKQIKWGFKASGQVHYMFWPNYGIGIDYQYHHSSGSMVGDFDAGDGYTQIYGEFTDNVFTNYVGASLISQQKLRSDNFVFYSQISMGITFYRDELIYVFSPTLITGKSFGSNIELGLDYIITKNISVGINSNFFHSTISKVKIDNGASYENIELTDEQKEGLSRLDFGAGIKFNF